MHRRPLFTLLPSLAIVSTLAADGFPVETRAAVPVVITSGASATAAAWVSERIAKDPNGNFNPHFLNESEVGVLRRGINARRAAASEATQGEPECKTFIGRHLEQFGEKRSLRDLAQNASAIFSARVIGSDQGFLYGQLGTLFALNVRAASKGPYQPDSIVYLFYPFARMTVADGLLCANPLGNVVVPRLGDELVAFPYLPSVAAHPPIVMLEPRWQLVVIRGARTHLPESLAHELNGAATAESILAAAQRLVPLDQNQAPAQ